MFSLFTILRLPLLHRRELVKCNDKKIIVEKNIQKEEEYIKYKELNDPEYFREDFYGLRKVCSSSIKNENNDK